MNVRKELFLLLVTLLFVCCLPAYAQIAGENVESELLSTDQSNGKLYYKVIPFALKKGQKALFFIKSTVFKPNIFLSTQTGQLIRSGSINEKTKEVQVSFAPSSDTSFLIILTSAEENKTGKFSSGYKVLDSLQTVYKEESSFCERFAYLFNQWQLEWEFIPGTKEMHYDDDEPEASYEYWAVSNKLINKSSAMIVNDYQEKLYSELIIYNTEADNFYQKTINDIKSCLDLSAWNIETEERDSKGLVANTHFHITHFIAKGSGRNDHLRSFKIVFKSGFLEGHEVTLVFN